MILPAVLPLAKLGTGGEERTQPVCQQGARWASFVPPALNLLRQLPVFLGWSNSSRMWAVSVGSLADNMGKASVHEAQKAAGAILTAE